MHNTIHHSNGGQDGMADYRVASTLSNISNRHVVDAELVRAQRASGERRADTHGKDFRTQAICGATGIFLPLLNPMTEREIGCAKCRELAAERGLLEDRS
jgi:hypothetical protein